MKVALGLASVVGIGFLAWKSGARGPVLILLLSVGFQILRVRLCACEWDSPRWFSFHFRWDRPHRRHHAFTSLFGGGCR